LDAKVSRERLLPRPVPAWCEDCGAAYNIVKRFSWCPHRVRRPLWMRLLGVGR
jgi:hypothetical protein